MRAPPGRIATLILPGDASWGEAGESRLSGGNAIAQGAAAGRVEAVARALKNAEGPILAILGGRASRGEGLELCRENWRLPPIAGWRRNFSPRASSAVPGAFRWSASPISSHRRWNSEDFRHIVTVETGEPVAFFSYPDSPSLLKPNSCAVHALAEKDEDGVAVSPCCSTRLARAAPSPESRSALYQPFPPESSTQPASAWRSPPPFPKTPLSSTNC